MVYLLEKAVRIMNDFFQCIMEEDDFNPESILTDFDTGTIKAINSLFLTNVIRLL